MPLRRAIAIDPEFAPAYFALAHVPVATGEAWTGKVLVLRGGGLLHVWQAVDSVWQTYDRLYRRAFMIDPLVDTRIAVSLQWRGGHQDRYRRARNDYDDGRFDTALKKLADIIGDSQGDREREPRLEEALWFHALAATRQAQYGDAINDLQRLIDISEKREAADTLIHRSLRTNEYRFVLAYVQQRAGNRDEAIRLYKDALQHDFGLYTAHVRLAEIYEAMGMWNETLAERQRAVDANPDDPSLLLDLGMTLAKAGQWELADQALRQAMDANPRDPRAPYYLGIVDQQLGKKDEARAAFDRFLAIAPSRYQRQIADARQRRTALQ